MSAQAPTDHGQTARQGGRPDAMGPIDRQESGSAAGSDRPGGKLGASRDLDASPPQGPARPAGRNRREPASEARGRPGTPPRAGGRASRPAPQGYGTGRLPAPDGAGPGQGVR